MKPSGDPTRLANIRFSFGWSGILAAAVIIGAWIYAEHAPWRPVMNFLGVGFAMAAAVLSAEYVGQGLKITVEQREEALKNEKIARAFVYVDAWDEPSLSTTRQTVRAFVETMRTNNHDQHSIKEEIEKDEKTEAAVLDVLNFLEGFCLASNQGVADDETLRRCFMSILSSYYLAFEVFLKAKRAEANRPHLYAELEVTVKRWSANPISPL